MNNKNRHPGWLFLGLLVAGFGLTGCQEGADLPSQTSVDRENGYARFDPSAGVIPFPNNLLFTGSQDGTLNIPVADPEDYSDPQVAMNALDGFSTLTSFRAQMSVPVDPASIVPGSSVRVFQVNLDPATGAVTGVSRELVGGHEFTAGLSPFDESTVVITPLAPLAPASGYVVTLGSGLKSTAGAPFGAELYYALAKGDSPLVDAEGISQYSGLSDAQAAALEPLRQLTHAAEAAVEGYTITDDGGDTIPDQSASEIILSWSFRTQSIGASLDAIATSVTAGNLQTTATGMNTKAVNPDLPGLADIHTGTLDVPYYSGIPTTADPTAPLNGFWRTAEGGFVTGYTPVPQANGTETIPVLMTLPNTDTMPAGGWPVVIFQHGITQNRTHLLAVADTLAAAGFAGIAIDLPLHGITDAASPFYADGTVARERTFGLDLIDNETRLPGPDSTVDPSGTHFINLASLLTTRDNVRQAVADLMTLTASLGTLAGDGAGNIDPTNVYFVGHSLGAMVGTPYLAHTPDVKAAVLASPGGGVAKLLDGSATFGPQIAEGLAAKGVVRGTPEYESFMLAAQTIVDTADPINYTSGAVTGRGVLMFEVVGGNSSPPDQVVPNNVLADAPDGVIPSPTAGTDPLARVMGLTRYGASAGDGVNALDAWVRFTAGHHGSLVTPNDAAGNSDPLSLAAFSEMQGQMAAFLAYDGTVLSVTDTDVVEQPATP